MKMSLLKTSMTHVAMLLACCAMITGCGQNESGDAQALKQQATADEEAGSAETVSAPADREMPMAEYEEAPMEAAMEGAEAPAATNHPVSDLAHPFREPGQPSASVARSKSVRRMQSNESLGLARGIAVQPLPGGEADGFGRVPPADSAEPLVQHNTEAYDSITENPFKLVERDPLSTFSIDVDTASYSNVRRMLNQGRIPPAGAVRIEEMVNYFSYDYTPPTDGKAPFAVHVESAGCAWAPDHRLVRIGLKGREIERDQRPPSNLVFLVDVSGSMRSSNKLPLLKSALSKLVEQLGADDHVALVVYASGTRVVLQSTACDEKATILAALDGLRAGGSTAGAAGIQLAYEQASQNQIPGGTNRVILCTDGDFNVGVTNRSELVEMIKKKAKSDIFLSIAGFGVGNYKDAVMEELTNAGNGNYSYIDTEKEAKKVFIDQMSGTLVTIAKDVKIQVDFNPNVVGAYRLIGYENRMLKAEDFKDDKKDAGEIGAGHSVTALYEIVPAGMDVPKKPVDPSKYATAKPAVAEAPKPAADEDENASKEMLTVRLRYKEPEGDTSTEFREPFTDNGQTFDEASGDFQFAAAVAEFGLLLRKSEYAKEAHYEHVINRAAHNAGADVNGYRSEFVELAKKAQQLAGE
ncbi:vWA domain-containing protein [Thalassoroseus pseudoceratinae]|uniref:vWA domain-containing protein n=1 Tax=Thalassoroseus pseudoceratinae TaxID=2713176 RepID=UPI00197E4F1E|nr:von Willebrand factor type A domain-containing protein [Thalassoroseus pseudoceratinae]